MQTPLLTVITATRNNARFLPDAIESILGQTFSDFEYLIVDDASTDDSATILARYAAADRRITILQNSSQRGRSLSRNRAIEQAQGTWLAIFDGDDISHPERFERQLAFIRTHHDIDYLGTGCRYISKETGIELLDRKFVPPLSHPEILWMLCFDFPLHHSSTMGRRSAFLKAGGYPSSLPVCEDIHMWMEMAYQGRRFANLDEQLLTYRVDTRPAYYETYRVVARQLHRGFLGRVLGRQVSNEVYNALWHSNESGKHEETVLSSIRAIGLLSKLWLWMLGLEHMDDGVRTRIATDLARRAERILQNTSDHSDNDNEVSLYNFGYNYVQKGVGAASLHSEGIPSVAPG